MGGIVAAGAGPGRPPTRGVFRSDDGRQGHGCEGRASSPVDSEHEELRETVRRVRLELLLERRRVGGRSRIPTRALSALRRARLPRPRPRATPAARGGPTSTTRSGSRSWPARAARRGGGGVNAHASIAMPPIFNFGTEEQKQRWLVPGIAGEKIGGAGGSPSRAPAPTSPGSRPSPRGPTAAMSSTAPRPSSPTAYAPISSSAPARQPRTAVTTGSRSCLQERDARLRGLGEARRSSAGTLRWASSPSPTSRSRPEPARRGERGLQADHVQLRLGAAADGDRGGRGDAAADRDDGRLCPRP